MSKRKQHKQQSRLNLYFTSAIVVVVAVFMAIFVSQGGTSATQKLSPTDYQTQFIASNTSHLLLDVRTPEEFASGHIEGAVNIPVESLQSRLSEVPVEQPVVVYCRSGNRSAQASRILANAGYTPIYDMGGLNEWIALGFPVE